MGLAYMPTLTLFQPPHILLGAIVMIVSNNMQLSFAFFCISVLTATGQRKSQVSRPHVRLIVDRSSWGVLPS